jgi:DNA-binding beta-propeller fold protein YncE
MLSRPFTRKYKIHIPAGVAVSNGEIFVAVAQRLGCKKGVIEVFREYDIDQTEWGATTMRIFGLHADVPCGLWIYEGEVHMSNWCNGNVGVRVYRQDGTFLRACKYGLGYLTAIQDQVFVERNDHTIQVFRQDGTFVTHWTWPPTPQPPCVCRVALSGEEVFVADCANHRIVVFGVDGTFRREWGSRGQELGQFRTPRGVAISQEGAVFVCDSGNDRVQAFSPEGCFLQKWDGLYFPTQISISKSGLIVVSDECGVHGLCQ